MLTGLQRIHAERARQIEQEGWNTDHDDCHVKGELLSAAFCYRGAAALMVQEPESSPLIINKWPWEQSWWKPGECPERCLEKAGALFLAEQARIIRHDGSENLASYECEKDAKWCGEKIDELFAKRLNRTRVIKLNECEWWTGESLEQAIAHYLREVHGINSPDDATLETLLMLGNDFLEADEILERPHIIPDEDMDRVTVWDDEVYDPKDYRHWRCECGAMAGPDCRWTGEAYEHSHGNPVGHVPMKCITRLTFRQVLVRDLIEGRKVPGLFWAIEP